MDTTDNCEWLHNKLEFLPLVKYPFDIKSLPMNGIYFFYEEGEINAHNNKPSLVRVGTHRNDNFRSRINEHYLLNGMDFDEDSPAPKDRSIFRKHIGRALLNKMKSNYLPVWDGEFTTKAGRNKYKGRRDIKFEIKMEKKITQMLRDKFSFRYIEIDDEDLRMGKNGMEKRLIGTLSHCGKCKSSPKWLGNHSPEKQKKIRESGLWLIQHLNSEGINDADKALIKRLVDSS